MKWPPPRPKDPEIPHRPWDPRHRQAPNLVKEHARLVYVVIDETLEGWVGLSLSQWPHADSEGRLRFVDPRGAVDVGTSHEALQRFLQSQDPGAAEARIGSAFAVRVKVGTAAKLLDELRDRAGHGEARIDDLGEFFERPVDITNQGRLLAKLASYGALLSTLPSKLEVEWNLQEEEET